MWEEEAPFYYTPGLPKNFPKLGGRVPSPSGPPMAPPLLVEAN